MENEYEPSPAATVFVKVTSFIVVPLGTERTSLHPAALTLELPRTASTATSRSFTAVPAGLAIDRVVAEDDELVVAAMKPMVDGTIAGVVAATGTEAADRLAAASKASMR